MTIALNIFRRKGFQNEKASYKNGKTENFQHPCHHFHGFKSKHVCFLFFFTKIRVCDNLNILRDACNFFVFPEFSCPRLFLNVNKLSKCILSSLNFCIMQLFCPHRLADWSIFSSPWRPYK